MSIERTRVAPGIWKRKGADGKDRYEITYRDSDGRQRRQVVEGGKRAAETALSDVKARMGKGERIVPSPRLTFGEAAGRYLAAQTALRPMTVAAYTTAIRTHLLPAWDRKRLDHIDVDEVARFVERMQTAAYRARVDQRLGRPESGKDGYAPWAIAALWCRPGGSSTSLTGASVGPESIRSVSSTAASVRGCVRPSGGSLVLPVVNPFRV